ncbi:MAG: rubrerythrin family protein [Candidatus Omnitrophota bacterium]
MKRLMILVLAVALLTAGGVAFAQEAAAPAVPADTLQNLQTAYNGESNANARYLAFADKAKAEGYLQVEKLFLAAAVAEQIHATVHAKVIRNLGAEPKMELTAPEVKTTLENLQAALKGETYEKDVMYPGFLAIAEKADNKDAQRAFRGAMLAEVEHAKLYSEAIANLEGWKQVTRQIIVCDDCGFTTTDTALKQCPVCSNPRKNFIEV